MRRRASEAWESLEPGVPRDRQRKARESAGGLLKPLDGISGVGGTALKSSDSIVLMSQHRKN